MATKVFGENQTGNDQQKDESNLPDQLKGKSSEEIFEILREEHDKEVNKIKADKLDSLTQEQEKAKRKPPPSTLPYSSRPGQTPPPPQQRPPISYNQPNQEEPDLYTNPEGFMDRQFQKRLGPLVQSQTAAMRNTNREVFRGRIKEEYEKYGEEIEQFVSALAPQLQADPRAYEQAYNFVRASHLDEIVEEKTEKKATEKLAATLAEAGLEPDRIAEIVGEASGNGSGDNSAPAASGSLFQRPTGVPRTAEATARGDSPPRSSGGRGKLTSDELRMMEEFGMSREEYLAYKAENSDTYSSLREGI